MKIMHIGQLIGGLDVYIRNSVEYAEGGFSYVILHGEDDNSKPVVRGGIPVKEYKICLHRELNLWRDLTGLVQTIRIIRKEKPDVIHCHSAKGGMFGRIAGVLTNCRVLYTPHAFSFLSAPNRLKRNIYLLLERITKFNAVLLACSESERELGVAKVKYRAERALAWNNSVPSAEGQNECAAYESKMPFVCCIGRPSYQKNPLFLVEVVKRVHEVYPELRFLLLGVGYYSPDLTGMKVKIEEYGLADVMELLPWLSHKETMGYVGKALFYLTVSRYEGLPLSVIEAMSLGKAIVASDVLGNKDCVKDGYNGFLLPLDADLFAQKIGELIDDEDQRKRMEANSLEYFNRDFLITNRIKDLEKIYL